MSNKDFKIDTQNALTHIILRQAGSLNKAFMEAIQNSLDANAKEIRITTVPETSLRDDSTQIETIRIIDDGDGLDSLDENFQIFATSHKDESQRGEFGIGRGQLFAKGSTIWKTKNYIISVDVMHNIDNNKNIGFNYKEVDDVLNGTDITVDLYRPEAMRLNSTDLLIVSNQVKLYWNGELINFKLQKKISNSDYVMYKIASGEVGGMFLKDIPVCKFSSVNLPNKLPYAINIISDKVKVNFARNEFITSDSETDELLDKIKISLLTEVVKRVKSKKKTHDYEKELLLKNITNLSAEELFLINDTPFLRTTNGQSFSLDELDGGILAETTGKTRLDDVLIQRGFKIVDWATLHSIKTLAKTTEMNVVFYDEYDSKRKAEQHYIPEERTKSVPSSKRELELCLYANITMKYIYKHEFRNARRKVFIGKSDSANAWTDGETYIVINDKYLKNNKYYLIFQIPRLVIHEMTHRNSEDYHDDDFFRRFHNLIQIVMEDKEFIKEMNLARDGTKKYLDYYGDRWGLTEE